MHNLMSYNQLAGWKSKITHKEETVEQSKDQSDLINDYYECLISCEDDQSSCKRVCKEILI